MTDLMKCGRPGCTEEENRIHGYCSLYCQDIHAEEIEVATLQAEIERLKGELSVKESTASAIAVVAVGIRADLAAARAWMAKQPCEKPTPTISMDGEDPPFPYMDCGKCPPCVERARKP